MIDVEKRELDLEGLKQELERVKKEDFMLEMKDNWSREDFDRSQQLHCQMRMLKEMISRKEQEQGKE